MANEAGLVYMTDEKSRSMRDTIVYSLQWLFIMFYGVVWGYALVGVGLGFTGEDLSQLHGRRGADDRRLHACSGGASATRWR